MNKQELIDHFQEQKEIIEKEIAFWQAQPDDVPEKPELRHGDFGVNETGSNRITFHNGRKNRDDYCSEGIVTDSEITVFGNIFDLMEGWGEPLGELEAGFSINLMRSFKPIRVCGTLYEKNEAEEIWRWLGHAIMELKRKEKV